MPDLPLSLDFQAARPPGPVQRFAGWASELQGWRRLFLAMTLGVLAALALPPFDVVPLVVVAFTGLVWLADSCQRRREAFLVGWSFGFGFLVAGLYWIAISMFTDIATYWWALPFAVAGLPAFLAVYPALALVAYHWAAPRGYQRALLLAALWTAAEWLRGHLLTGFPWNLIGYVWSGDFPGATAVLQVTAVTGIYGLSLLTVALAALPASLGDPPIGARWRRLAPLAAGLALIAAIAGAGAARLAAAAGGSVPGVVLRLVQPSTPLKVRWDEATSVADVRKLLALSASPGAERVTDIIWPEGAVPYYLNRDETAAVRQALASVAPEHGLVITGGVRANASPEPISGVWNSLVAIDRSARIVATYDKVHLVPFGEYVPFRAILPFKKLTAGSIDFSTGPGPQTMDLPGLPPAAPMICYEVIFPGAFVDEAHRPGWILTVTNDGWFGFSSGPFQHFDIARTRAVEEGLPLVRVANNGISGVVDAYGHVIVKSGLDSVGVLDSGLPLALPPTPYVRFGDAALILLMLLCVAPVGPRLFSKGQGYAN